MKRLFLLSVLCLLVLGISAQTAKEEIFADVHRSAANYYAYPAVTTARLFRLPITGLFVESHYVFAYVVPFCLSLSNPDDYEQPLEVMREADRNGVLTGLGNKTLCVLDSMSRMAKGRYGELTPLGARQHRGIAKRMYKNFPEIFKGQVEIDARSTVLYAVFIHDGRM